MIATIISVLTGGLFKSVENIFHDYANQKISVEEAKAKIATAQADAEARMEVAWTQAQAQMQESLMQTIRVSPVMQKMYVIVLFMQLGVLVWYQLGTSCWEVIVGTPFPPPMADIGWCYAIVGGMSGAAPFIFKTRNN